MDESKKDQKVTKKRKKGGGTKLRHATVRSLATQGLTHEEIAEEVGLRRQQIGRILSNAETQELIRLGEDRMKGLMTKAIDTLEHSLDNKEEFQQMGHAIKSALAILKSLGVMKDKTEIDLGIRPGVKVIDLGVIGQKIILGKEEGDEE